MWRPTTNTKNPGGGSRPGIGQSVSNAVGHQKCLPFVRMGEIPDSVESVLNLQSANFVTGENLRVDGGVHARGK
jgi:hypothetical protein